jgi:hypothetical protein
MRFLVAPANVAEQVLTYLFKGFTGGYYGDKGYLTSTLEELLEKGIHLITKVRRNMKNMLLTLEDKLNLLKRGSIEAVNDILMSVCDIDHSRHRNPLNALVHIFAGLAAYTFLDHKQKRFNPARLIA